MRPADPGVVGDLERILSPDRVLSRPIDRLGRSADASIYRLIPEAIVRPRSVGEIRDLLAWAARPTPRSTAWSPRPSSAPAPSARWVSSSRGPAAAAGT